MTKTPEDFIVDKLIARNVARERALEKRILEGDGVAPPSGVMASDKVRFGSRVRAATMCELCEGGGQKSTPDEWRAKCPECRGTGMVPR